MTEVWSRQYYIKGHFYPLTSKATTAERNFVLATPLASLSPFLCLFFSLCFSAHRRAFCLWIQENRLHKLYHTFSDFMQFPPDFKISPTRQIKMHWLQLDVPAGFWG